MIFAISAPLVLKTNRPHFMGVALRVLRLRLGFAWELFGFSVFVLLLTVIPAQASVMFDAAQGRGVQTVNLTKGWNSVYLWVQPDNQDLSALLVSMPQITKVATYAQPVSRATMLESDSENFTREAGWKVWRSTAVLSKVNTLKGLLGGRGYLFYAESPVSLSLAGEYVDYDNYASWVGDRFNFQSFPVQANTISFSSYLATQKKLDAALIYTLVSNGSWALVDPRSLIDPEKAYWVYCYNGTDFSGSVQKVATPVFFKPQNDTLGGLVYEAELGLSTKSRSSTTLSLASNLPITAKLVRPGQYLNVSEQPYLALSAINLELSEQTSPQATLFLRLPAAAVTSQLKHHLELNSSAGDKKFYPIEIEGNTP